MTDADKQELAFTRKRVNYSNTFLGEQKTKNLQLAYAWHQLSQDSLYNRMVKQKMAQIISAIKMDPLEASEFLFRNPELNKIHSCYLDFFEELPFRPDVGFDLLWNGSYAYKMAAENLLRIIPISTCRFLFVRIFIEREIRTANQFPFIKDRAKSVLGEEVYDALVKRFLTEEGIPKENHYQGARLLKKMLAGESFHIGEKDFTPLNLSTRLHAVISLVLYTSRCERFHGDNFSHFKSDRASIKTYGSWYWLLLSTYFIFWLLFQHICIRRNAVNIVTEDSIVRSFSECLKCFSKIFTYK